MPAHVRMATRLDREDIRDVHLRAFPDSENHLVAALAVDLLDQASDPETIALVAEIDGGIVGHIAFSPARAQTGENWLGYILAPLGVRPEHHNMGIGAQLVHSGMELLSQKMVDAVFVYGDPKYYARFGFSAQAASHFIPPYALAYPFGWQARILRGEGPPGQAVQLTCVPSLRDPALW